MVGAAGCFNINRNISFFVFSSRNVGARIGLLAMAVECVAWQSLRTNQTRLWLSVLCSQVRLIIPHLSRIMYYRSPDSRQGFQCKCCEEAWWDWSPYRSPYNNVMHQRAATVQRQELPTPARAEPACPLPLIIIHQHFQSHKLSMSLRKVLQFCLLRFNALLEQFPLLIIRKTLVEQILSAGDLIFHIKCWIFGRHWLEYAASTV